MYTWEKYFVQVINGIRCSEINFLRWTAVWKSLLIAPHQFLPKLGLFASILSYILLGYILTPDNVFSLVTFYATIRILLNMTFPNGIYRAAELWISINRIQTFLTLEEMESPNVITNQTHKDNKTNVSIHLEDVSAKWDSKSSENTIYEISVLIERPKLIAVIGLVGSGKTTFLNVLLKELALTKGEIKINGSISYSSQQPWLFRGTIKENILFGLPYQDERYKNVIKVCALQKDLQLFPCGDLTIVAENGANLSGGQRARVSLARAVYRQADIYLLDDPLSAVDANVADFIFNQCISTFLREKCTIVVTNQLQFVKHVDYIYMFKNGKINANGTYKHLQEAGFKFLEESTCNKVESKDKLQEEYDSEGKLQENELSESRDDGVISFKVYQSYLQAGGKVYIYIVLFLILVIYQTSTSCFDGAMAYWSNIDYILFNNGKLTNSPLTRTDYTLSVSIILVLVIIFALTSHVVFFMLLVNCSKNLHNNSFEKIISAPMRFFHMNPSGRIVNRFSRDLGLLDDYIAPLIIDTIQIAFVIAGVFIIVGVINYWLSIVMLAVVIVFYILRELYLPHSIEIKRLEGLAKSPLYTHIKASYKGLRTVRAFDQQEEYKRIFDDLQDTHTSSYFMFLSSTHAIGTLIDIPCAFLVCIVTFSFFLVGDSLAGTAGLAITQAILLMSLSQWGIRQSCEMAVTMTSVERLTEYLHLERDGQDTKRNFVPKESWPQQGAVEFIDTCLQYSPIANPVLKNINIKIEPCKKVGIVGRTGSGKTSLSLALFQLAYTDGSILIDDVDITRVSLPNLRNKISIIPQEPLLFTATMRRNLDPYNEFNDSDLWEALAEVELKEVVAAFPEGLLTKMSEGGSNLSVGQRQLACLARAIIRENKILIMDEATANVDSKTDALIQTTIRRKFKTCTVLTIAHRLHTIIDSDLVLVMDAGEVKEFDHPHLLLQNKNGTFYQMVEKQGGTMSRDLHEIAQNVFNNMTTVSS